MVSTAVLGGLAHGCSESSNGGNGAGASGVAGNGGSVAGSGGAGASTPGGSGGSSSGGFAGSAGSAPNPGAHCEGGAVRIWSSLSSDGILNSCSGIDAYAHGLPNPAVTFISSITLPEPTTAGQPYALSIEATTTSSANLEIWGAREECGSAQELLWFGPLRTKINCAEFVPSQVYTNVLTVIRKLDAGDIITLTQSAAFCPASSCPSGNDGTGLTPGSVLEAPVGPYDGVPSTQGDALSVTFSRLSGSLFARAATETFADDVPTPLLDGLLHVPPTDPLGDGWYCFGENSTATVFADAELELEFALQSLTRLGACKEPGTRQLTVTQGASETVIETDVPGIPASFPSFNARCINHSCTFYFGNVLAPHHLRVQTTEDVGLDAAPTLVTAPVSALYWIARPDPEGPFQISCATGGGTLYYDPAGGMTTFNVQGMTDFLSCPGEPATRNEFAGSFY